MPAALTAKSESKKKSKAPASEDASFESPRLIYSGGATAGLPRFLGGAAGVQVQHKCAKCQEEEEKQAPVAVQSKCACCGGGSCRHDRQPGKVQSTALRGVDGASRPLPYLDRIQASFGRHDVSGARAQVGGPAADANQRMGSLAYTAGDRVAFQNEPNVNLAAHEAAHVVQQRSGAKLPNGVGRPGDEYEQQADAAAEAVERGQSAESILDGGNHAGPSGSAPVVQHQLQVDAVRMFEPAIAPSDAGLGSPAEREKPAADNGKPVEKQAEAKSGDKEKEQDKEEGGGKKTAGGPKGQAQASNAPAAGSGPASGTQPSPQADGQTSGAQPGPGPAATAPDSGATPATPGPTAAPDAGGVPSPSSAPAPTGAGGAPAPAGQSGASCTPACYHEPSEEPEDESSDEKPPNPPQGESEEQTSDADEPDLPEPDDCPTQQEQAGAPGGGQSQGAPDGGGQASPAAPSGSAQPGTPQAAAPGGVASSPAAAGGAAPAPAVAKAPAGRSPMEGTIAQSEGQRAAAVADYEAASKALQGSSSASADLRSGVEFAAPATGGSDEMAQRDAATERAGRFFSDAADRLDAAIAFASGQAPDQLGAQAEAAKAGVLASAQAQKGAVSTRIAGAREEARADASIARRAVMQQADSFVEQIQTGSAETITALTAAHAATMGQVDALETATLDQINQIYANGRAQLEGLGVTVGDECTAIGEQFAATYEGFEHCTENGFWDGDLSERRAHAQAEAARKTAKGYHDRMMDAAKKRAREVARNGRKNNRCQVIATATAVRQKLDETLAQLTSAIEAARDHAIEQASNTRAALLAGIDGALQTTLGQLDRQEHDQRQAIDDTCYLQEVLQEQMAHSAAASLQGVVTSGASALHDSLAMLRGQFASHQAPDPKALDEALNAASLKVGAAIDGMQSGLLSGTAMALQQLDASLGAGLAALDAAVASNDESAAALTSGFGASMGAIAGQDNFASQRAGFNQLLQQATTGGTDGFQKIFGAMQDGCGKVAADSQKALQQAAGDLEKNLRQSKQGIECQITKEADEAASHEAPAWKRLIAILLIIVVIIIVIVVTVLTAGAGLGLFAVLALGAVVGAVTSGLITMATNLWTNQAVTKGVGHAMVMGAITGALGGVVGMGIGAGLGQIAGKVLSEGAIEFASLMLTTAVMDVGQHIYDHGFSFKNFSWSNLGLSLVIAALTFGLSKAVHPTEISISTPEGGAPAVEPGAVEPATEPVPPEPTPTEPTPTEPTPTEPTPTEPPATEPPATEPPAEPAPAEPTPPETTPSEPAPSEPPAPKEPVPPEPAAPPEPAPAPAEPKPAEPAPVEPTEPVEPAPPGEAPVSPEEKAVLDQTSNKPSEELTPEEALTEKEIANRTEGEPIDDPPFTTEKELPNGHEVEETPEGDEFKRCSDKCAVFNSETGEPVGSEIADVFGEETMGTSGLSPSDPDVLNVPEEGQATELPDDFGVREPAEPEGATPKPAQDAPQQERLDWLKERLQMHVDEAVERYEVEGLTPNEEAAARPGLTPNEESPRPLTEDEEMFGRQGQSPEMFRGSRIDQFAKETIMQDPELAEIITAPDFISEPDILDSVLPDWFDITTLKAWQAHVVKYGPRYGATRGHLLPTR